MNTLPPAGKHIQADFLPAGDPAIVSASQKLKPLEKLRYQTESAARVRFSSLPDEKMVAAIGISTKSSLYQIFAEWLDRLTVWLDWKYISAGELKIPGSDQPLKIFLNINSFKTRILKTNDPIKTKELEDHFDTLIQAFREAKKQLKQSDAKTEQNLVLAQENLVKWINEQTTMQPIKNPLSKEPMDQPQIPKGPVDQQDTPPSPKQPIDEPPKGPVNPPEIPQKPVDQPETPQSPPAQLPEPPKSPLVLNPTPEPQRISKAKKMKILNEINEKFEEAFKRLPLIDSIKYPRGIIPSLQNKLNAILKKIETAEYGHLNQTSVLKALNTRLQDLSKDEENAQSKDEENAQKKQTQDLYNILNNKKFNIEGQETTIYSFILAKYKNN